MLNEADSDIDTFMQHNVGLLNRNNSSTPGIQGAEMDMYVAMAAISLVTIGIGSSIFDAINRNMTMGA